jgi:integrase
MASIHKHSSKRSPFWFAKFSGADGRPCVKTTKQRDRKKAIEVAMKFEKIACQAKAGLLTESQARKVVAELYEVGSGQPLELATAKEFFEQWRNVVKNKNAGGTFLRYDRTIETFIAGLGPKANLDLRHINARDILAFREREVKKGLSNKTSNLAVNTIRIALNVAKRQQLIPHNPVDGVEPLPADGEARHCFTDNQILKLLTMPDKEWRGMVLIGYYVGPRISVCAKMTRGQFDTDSLWIKYTPNKLRRGSSPQEIICPMHPEVKKYILSLPKTWKKDHPIFPSLSSRTTSGKTGLSETFQDLMIQAGIDVPKGREKEGSGRQFRMLGFHSLRHTFNSNLANAGVSQEIRKRLVGHKSDDVNDTYTHLSKQALTDAMAKLPATIVKSE